MAAPTIVASATTASAGDVNGTLACTIPAGIAGDLLVLIFSKDGNSPPAGPPAGWTEISRGHHNAGDILIATRRADGTEGATVTVTWVGLEAAVASVRRVQGDSPADAPQVGAYTDSLAASVPVAALSPTWGLADVLWIAIAYSWGPVVDTMPNGYGNILSVQTGATTADAAQKTASRAASTATESPSDVGVVAGRWVSTALMGIRGAVGGSFAGEPGGGVW